MACASSLTLYYSLLPTPSAIYALGLSKSLASLTLHVSALDPATGNPLASVEVPSALQSVADVLSLFTAGGEPVLVWLEAGGVRTLALDAELRNKPAAAKAAGKNLQRLVDVRLAKHGMFVAVQSDGAGALLRLDAKATLEQVTVFAESVSDGLLIEDPS
jgi:hypothetical protein